MHPLGCYKRLIQATGEKPMAPTAPLSAPLMHPLKGYRWGTGQKTCPVHTYHANVPPLGAFGAGAHTARIGCLGSDIQHVVVGRRPSWGGGGLAS